VLPLRFQVLSLPVVKIELQEGLKLLPESQDADHVRTLLHLFVAFVGKNSAILDSSARFIAVKSSREPIYEVIDWLRKVFFTLLWHVALEI
jgi:hypothetical protein